MKYEEFKAKYNLRLTEPQEKAVQSVNGPVLLLAVPGSGKTTVLISRLGYMTICLGIDPRRILTVTYTVAATKDMRSRFTEKFGDAIGRHLNFSTINSLCNTVIRESCRMTKRTPFTLVSDEKYILRLIARIMREENDGEYPQESEVKSLRTLFTYIKNMLLTEDEIEQLEEEYGHHLAKVYHRYQSAMRNAGLMDFDDQMVYAYNLLKIPAYREYFQKMYDYICVDESQDTSLIQHKIITLLTDNRDNLFMVGDEDQSIYAYRAAYPEALLNFAKDHKGAKVLLMEENFRSDANIVTAANKFIQKNRMRHKKLLMTNKKGENPITKIKVERRSEQFEFLSGIPKYLQEPAAVLFRDNESMIPLVDMLDRKKQPYRIKKTELNFFTDKTIMDIRSFFRLSLYPNDAEAFKQIYYKMGVKITKEQCKYIVDDMPMRYPGITVMESAKRIFSGDWKVMRALCVVENLKNRSTTLALEDIYGELNYSEFMSKRNINPSKFATAKMLARNENNIAGFLGRLDGLQNLISNKSDDEDAKLILSTIHGSKGLEYDTVYLLDQFDTVTGIKFPDKDSRTFLQDVKEYEEERRIFYVAVTRAKKHLVVFHSQWLDSIFVDELIKDAVTVNSTAAIITGMLKREKEKELERNGNVSKRKVEPPLVGTFTSFVSCASVRF